MIVAFVNLSSLLILDASKGGNCERKNKLSKVEVTTTIANSL